MSMFASSILSPPEWQQVIGQCVPLVAGIAITQGKKPGHTPENLSQSQEVSGQESFHVFILR